MKADNPLRGELCMCACASLLFLCLAGTAAAQSGGWQNEIVIYGWLAGLDGTVGLPGGMQEEISVEAADILDSLNMVFMGGYEGRYDRWSIVADVMYLDVSNDEQTQLSSGTASIDLGVTSWVLHGIAGYDLVHRDDGRLAVVGGVRYLNLDAEIALGVEGAPVGSRSASDDLIDGLVGIRGHFDFTGNWFVPFYADIGTGGSDLSYQLFAGIGYRFGWGDIRLGYRYLEFDLEDDKLMQDLKLYGPLLGVGFRF